MNNGELPQRSGRQSATAAPSSTTADGVGGRRREQPRRRRGSRTLLHTATNRAVVSTDERRERQLYHAARVTGKNTARIVVARQHHWEINSESVGRMKELALPLLPRCAPVSRWDAVLIVCCPLFVTPSRHERMRACLPSAHKSHRAVRRKILPLRSTHA